MIRITDSDNCYDNDGNSNRCFTDLSTITYMEPGIEIHHTIEYMHDQNIDY